MPDRINPTFVIFTNDGLTRSDTGCFIAVPIWQHGNSGRQRVNGLGILHKGSDRHDCLHLDMSTCRQYIHQLMLWLRRISFSSSHSPGASGRGSLFANETKTAIRRRRRRSTPTGLDVRRTGKQPNAKS